MMAFVVNKDQELLLKKVKSKDADSHRQSLALPQIKGYNVKTLETRIEALVRSQTKVDEITRREMTVPKSAADGRISFQKIMIDGVGRHDFHGYIWVKLKDMENLSQSGMLKIGGVQYQLLPPTDILVISQIERQLSIQQKVVRIDRFR